MIQKFINSLKMKDYIYFLLFIILFFLVIKKNIKEKFSWKSPTSDTEFKTKVKSALSDNYQSIQNLSTLSSQISSADSVLDLSGVHLKVKDLGLKFGSSFIDTRTEIKTTLPNYIDSKTKTNSDNFINLKTKYNGFVDMFVTASDHKWDNELIQLNKEKKECSGNPAQKLLCLAGILPKIRARRKEIYDPKKLLSPENNKKRIIKKQNCL